MSTDETAPTCTDCNQTMELGFIPDVSHLQYMNQTQPMIWHAGEPVNATFLTMETGAIEIKPGKTKSIISYRCPDCGLLKSYAK